MKKISFSFVLFIGILQTMNAQNPFSVANTSTNFVTGTSGAQQMTQDNATGNIGIGIDPTYTDCALAVTNANYGSPPTIIMGVGNMVNGLTLGPGTSAASFACIRVDNSTTPVTTAHTPLAIDFMVDAYGLVGIGAPASYGSDGFAHLFLTDPNPSGTVPLMRVITNAATDAFFIGSNGNVGIGTISPSSKFDVAGSANFQNSIAVAQNSFTNGNTYQYGTLYTGGIADFNNDVNIEGNANVSTNLSVSGTSVLSGKVQIGGYKPISSTYSGYTLSVSGLIVAKECYIEMEDWADDVFEKKYPLNDLEILKNYILVNKHLPEIPSECEVIENGIAIGEMNKLLLKKIEELTLYVIQLKEENIEIKKTISNISNQ